jgi:hypothetical protein
MYSKKLRLMLILIMQKIVKNTILNYIQNAFGTETIPHPERFFETNKKPVQEGEIVYLMDVNCVFVIIFHSISLFKKLRINKKLKLFT